MKLKINWGTGIVIAMVLFMIFILQFVYRISVYDKYDHHLVADDYYKDELNYQEQIDKEESANKLIENVKIIKTDLGLNIVFPKEFESGKISGEIKFLRPSNIKLDLKKKIELLTNTFFISSKELVSGKYNIIVDWQYDAKGYMYKTAYFY
ncbi:MAG: FixH family protein [Flavobacteriaceae bacterium]|nr:FixH family protein [Flavobacteriaceae bacterium]